MADAGEQQGGLGVLKRNRLPDIDLPSKGAAKGAAPLRIGVNTTSLALLSDLPS